MGSRAAPLPLSFMCQTLTHPTRIGSEACPPLPSPIAYHSGGRSPRRLQIPSRVLPTPRCRSHSAQQIGQGRSHQAAACASRGFFPYSVLPATGSHQPPTRSQLAGFVASSGFRTLSTLCSPHGLPGLFHPDPAHGVCPPRPCSSDSAGHPFERRVPLGVKSSRKAVSSCRA